MKGFGYITRSEKVANCSKLDEEICNGGPLVWMKLKQTFNKCPKPCKLTHYKSSSSELIEMTYVKMKENQATFELSTDRNRNIVQELLVYDTNDMIGSIGGSLGLFLGFSFFDIISKCLDKFINRVSECFWQLEK